MKVKAVVVNGVLGTPSTYVGWERSCKDNLSDNNNAAMCTEANEESVFIVEILLIVYDLDYSLL